MRLESASGRITGLGRRAERLTQEGPSGWLAAVHRSQADLEVTQSSVLGQPLQGSVLSQSSPTFLKRPPRTCWRMREGIDLGVRSLEVLTLTCPVTVPSHLGVWPPAEKAFPPGLVLSPPQSTVTSDQDTHWERVLKKRM